MCLSLPEMVISLPFDLTGRYSNGAIDSLMVANFIQSVMNGISLFFPKHYEAIFRERLSAHKTCRSSDDNDRDALAA